MWAKDRICAKRRSHVRARDPLGHLQAGDVVREWAACGREQDPSTGQGVKVLMLQEKESATYSAGPGEPVKNFKKVTR